MDPAPRIACIALGSNLGDRRATIAAAIEAIAALPGTTLRAASDIIETDPVGPPGQPNYLNAAVSIDTTLNPRELLEALLAIERTHGRERREWWGPRTLDLDLVLYADEVIDEPGLTVPHPSMRERLFVLEPLAQIEPGLVDPATGRSIRELLEALLSGGVEGARQCGDSR
ncbi:MAG: 2-amino-4-hydroxy-6-hydroxymethyldihydropteridine diphosphokinase [Phycisphaeraceae bacterium]|nr:MAG: 2-amino-4-hydroxy-6-hydroxymethyldihydropteridine diphosphokinase [Phycisphaeraceae bacterium]